MPRSPPKELVVCMPMFEPGGTSTSRKKSEAKRSPLESRKIVSKSIWRTSSSPSSIAIGRFRSTVGWPSRAPRGYCPNSVHRLGTRGHCCNPDYEAALTHVVDVGAADQMSSPGPPRRLSHASTETPSLSRTQNVSFPSRELTPGPSRNVQAFDEGDEVFVLGAVPGGVYALAAASACLA